MKIKEITSQSRRDFTAIFVCEHCNFEVKKSGYDDAYFHDTVIPGMKCIRCNQVSDPVSYRPLATKYKPEETV
ncbi:unnamed protein product [marine sediment metagenome]|uniref:Uncharacterized protein n=1 Tax=marine sediment metagenome TaxID=412755 RepID=X0TNA2_9ZZZZ